MLPFSPPTGNPARQNEVAYDDSSVERDIVETAPAGWWLWVSMLSELTLSEDMTASLTKLDWISRLLLPIVFAVYLTYKFQGTGWTTA